MKENKQLYVAEKTNNTVAFSAYKNSKFETNNYFISKDFEKYFVGTFITGYFENLRHFLDLKEFKIEVSK
jgi:hypothetical protein